MPFKLYAFVLLGLVALSGCQRPMVGGFQASRTEPMSRTRTQTSTPAESVTPTIPAPEAAAPLTEAVTDPALQPDRAARATPRVVTPPAESVQSERVAPEVAESSPASPVEATALTPPVEAPALTASVTKKLAAAAKGTKYESRVAQLTTTLEKAMASPKTNLAPQKQTLLEKAVSKVVMKKVAKQITKAKKAQDTQALNRDVKIGLILLIVGLVLALLVSPALIGSVVAVVGLVFLLIGLISQA